MGKKVIFPGRSLKTPVPPKPAPLKKKYASSGEEMDHSPVNFGKYKGQTPSQIAEHDPSYLVYMAGIRSEQFCSDVLINDCKKDDE